MRLVRIDTIEPGACLAQDVSWGHTVVPQLRAGVVLTDTYLERLQQAGLSLVYVKDPEEVVDQAPELAADRVTAGAASTVADELAPDGANDALPAAGASTDSRLRRLANAFRGSRPAFPAPAPAKPAPPLLGGSVEPTPLT